MRPNLPLLFHTDKFNSFYLQKASNSINFYNNLHFESYIRGIKMKHKSVLVAIGYSVLTMILGPLWHFILFKDTYEGLEIYNRQEPLIPLGFASMILQSVILAYLFSYFYKPGSSSYKSGITFSLVMGLFMFSTTTMANAAKIHVASMSTWFLVQIGFHLVQFIATGVLIGFIYRRK
jgi:hypothetical protein